MKRLFDLSPLGTAREAIAVTRIIPPPDHSAASEQELLNWYRQIREPLKAQYSIEDEVALIAWELARWQDGLTLIEQQAVILLVLTVLVQHRQGSTRIRLRSEKGRSIRLGLARRLLEEIKPTPGTIDLEETQAVELVDSLIDSQKLRVIVGSHG